MERARGRTTYVEVEESEADLERLRTWLSRIKARDWFGAPEATAAETAVERCTQILAEFEAEALAAVAPSRRRHLSNPRAGGFGPSKEGDEVGPVAVSSAAEVIRVLRTKTDEKVAVALRRL